MNDQQHTREYLIERIKKMLITSSASHFHNFCRSGLESALAELAKPVLTDDMAAELAKPTLPDDAEKLIKNALERMHNINVRSFADIAYDIHKALLPKPKTKTVWRVDRGPGWVEYATESEAMGVARAWVERGEIVRIDKQEVLA